MYSGTPEIRTHIKVILCPNYCGNSEYEGRTLLKPGQLHGSQVKGFHMYLNIMYVPVSVLTVHIYCTYLFCLIPQLGIAHVFLRASGQIQFVGEPKDAIDSVQEVQTTIDFLSDL